MRSAMLWHIVICLDRGSREKNITHFSCKLRPPHTHKQRDVLELERVIPVILEHPHDLVTHPLDLRLGKLHHVITHVVQESYGVGTQPRLLVTPHLILCVVGGV